MHKGQTKDIRTTIKQFSKKMKNLPEVEHSEITDQAVEKEKKKTEIQKNEVLAQKMRLINLLLKMRKNTQSSYSLLRKSIKFLRTII